MIEHLLQGGAAFSPDYVFRYLLVRHLWEDVPLLGCVGLNPSKAGAVEDDPTVRRWLGFAKANAYGGIAVGNLYAFRATDPEAMIRAADPVGPDNDAALADLGRACRKVLCSWGALPRTSCQGRADRAAEILRSCGCELLHLGLTKGGQPRHPLYMPAASPLRPWGAP